MNETTCFVSIRGPQLFYIMYTLTIPAGMGINSPLSDRRDPAVVHPNIAPSLHSSPSFHHLRRVDSVYAACSAAYDTVCIMDRVVTT